MKKIRSVVILTGLLLSAATASRSQQPDVALLQRYPLPTATPPLNSGMPYNVLIGYILGDSLSRTLSIATQDSLVRNLTYSDTLRYALKYIYEMVDHDPIRFYQWGSYRPVADMYPSPPAMLRSRIIESAQSLYPDFGRTAMLSSADVIVHVRVGSTQGKIDSSAAYARHAVLVNSTIVESIKGHRIPNCSMSISHAKREDPRLLSALAVSDGDQPAATGACLQFEYRLEWPRINHSAARTSADSTLVDGNGNEWIQGGHEYIVFLRILGLSRSGERDVTVLTPIPWFGTACSMYPIINGKVYDPYNDFGFGTGLTPDQFKAALRFKIQAVTNP